jgi:hypothetical protein
MTKKVRTWWRTVTFWNKIKLTLISLGVGSEVTLHIADSSAGWKMFAAGCTIAAVIITNFFNDSDNNGQVDILEHKPQI